MTTPETRDPVESDAYERGRRKELETIVWLMEYAEILDEHASGRPAEIRSALLDQRKLIARLLRQRGAGL